MAFTGRADRFRTIGLDLSGAPTLDRGDVLYSCAMSIADSISLGCWRDGDSEPFANLIVRDDVGERSVHGAGRVPPDCRLDCESETIAEDETPFVLTDDSEWQVALMSRRQQQYGFVLATMMRDSDDLFLA